MNKTNSLLNKITLLPEDLKSEVALFVEFLLEKKKKNDKRVPLKAGFLKDTFIVSDDFDAPLEDFKDYM